MNTRELTRLCRLWQRRLRLSDWTVRVELVPELPDALGDVDPIDSEMEATIRIVDGPQAEATLLHELLHLRLRSFGEDDTDARQTDMNVLADCFLRAYPRRKIEVSNLRDKQP